MGRFVEAVQRGGGDEGGLLLFELVPRRGIAKEPFFHNAAVFIYLLSGRGVSEESFLDQLSVGVDFVPCRIIP
jgi:hypothetical protein